MTHLDPNLAQKIVHEVKFQGVFDEFRKDSIADVDTKPAYLNLRQRVESAVQKFLSEQRWTPDTNKYQLRDRLRRHIAESGFLDVGVERIVDQVVNPKIGSVFQPRIEEIAYKYLGLPLPAKRELPPMPLTPFPINGNALKIETTPSEQENLLPKDLEQVSPDSDKTAVLEDEKIDEEEDESPPFEPITECKSPIKVEKVESNDIKVEVKSEVDDKKLENEIEEKPIAPDYSAESEQTKPLYQATTTPVKDECPSVDGLASQESQLSQVSSETASNQLNQSGSDPPTNLENAANANISEEAQMPKFNENSTETEDNSKKNSDLHFDIKKDEIKFEGTERKPNHFDGEQNESINDEPAVISSAFNALDIEAKGAFNFAKLVKVEPCNTQDPASSVSSQDDTSSAQLCIVEKSEHDLLQTDTNSLQQKALPEESSAAALNNSQTKVNDEKRKSKSSSTSSSRHKKSSKSSKRSPERSHRNEDKDHRDRSNNRNNDRHSENRHTSKHHHSSTEKHSSSSKRDEKVSYSSRSESQSRHSSTLKKDTRDRHDSKKHKSHKSNRNDKDSYKSRKSTTTDDHNESKDKIRRRKSTDSNDEDKSQGGPNGTTNSTNNVKSLSEGTSTTTTTTGNTKSTNNDSSKHSSKDHKQKSVSNKLSMPDKVNISSSMVVVVNEILTDPSLGFVELETKPKVTTIQASNVSADEEGELLYFEHDETDLQQRLNLLDEAISRCDFAYKAIDQAQQSQTNCHHIDSSKANITKNNNNNNNVEMDKKMKATLQVECYQFAHNDQQQSSSSNEQATPSEAKRSKFDTDCGMSKENEMNEKNAIKTDTTTKKTVVAKRVDSMAKQRYSSEDLYKPRPILGQRLKRRGLDA